MELIGERTIKYKFDFGDGYSIDYENLYEIFYNNPEWIDEWENKKGGDYIYVSFDDYRYIKLFNYLYTLGYLTKNTNDIYNIHYHVIDCEKFYIKLKSIGELVNNIIDTLDAHKREVELKFLEEE